MLVETQHSAVRSLLSANLYKRALGTILGTAGYGVTILIRTPGRTDYATIKKSALVNQARDGKAIAKVAPVTAEPKPAAKRP
jgi:hypothetical protein